LSLLEVEGEVPDAVYRCGIHLPTQEKKEGKTESWKTSRAERQRKKMNLCVNVQQKEKVHDLQRGRC